MTNLSGEPTFTPYQSENLAEVLEFVGECNRLLGFDNYHSGDIAHWMSNTFRGQNLGEHFGLLRDAESKIIALNIISSVKSPSFELILHPRYRGLPLELALLKISEKMMLGRLAAASVTATSSEDTSIAATSSVDKKPFTTLASNDKGRKLFLEEMGYQRDPGYIDIINSRSLTEPIPEPALPPGFIIRSAAGQDEAAKLAEVHRGSFNSKWTGSSYLELMRTPGYAAERERVVVAPDGTFAAFLIYWPDPVSKSFLFEPVGCHKDFQRKGLTKALMYNTMHRMKAAGLETAIVLYNGNNEAGKALYTSVGFRPVFEAYEYRPTKN
jgi:ribosomal protein S18 acetylase RimI-like enzyme